ncbi:hypothetical protein [Sneathiella glossodoripedis]|uniref:hypothetical protein n=1 Tax=Sneathiella glossodoripedis TaxID=418853 RepID=UPI001F1E9B43|nr:hypothetical protein [Sneathiella glossodoripedis]
MKRRTFVRLGLSVAAAIAATFAVTGSASATQGVTMIRSFWAHTSLYRGRLRCGGFL